MSLMGSCFNPSTGLSYRAEGELEKAGGQSWGGVTGQSIPGGGGASEPRVHGMDYRFCLHFPFVFYPEQKHFPFFFPLLCLSLLSLLSPPVLTIAPGAPH